MKHEIEKQIEFLMEIDKSKGILRMNWMLDQSRREDDAQHACHACLTAMVLQKYAARPVDIGHVIQMLLVHDIVEIDAGDTYAYDAAAKATEQERETKGADRIFGILPPDQGRAFRALWEEFNRGDTPEARFAHAMDNFQPVMLNAATDGKAWAEHGVRLSQILKRNQITPDGSAQLWEYAYQHFILPNVEQGRIRNDTNA